jgi:Family of unknown function (DUF6065)
MPELSPAPASYRPERAAGEGQSELVAYHSGPQPPMAIVAAARWRDWMSATHLRWANRCLPLLMANEAGWFLLNPVAFTATWDGGIDSAAVEIRYDPASESTARYVRSHFGYGVITWGIPYLFRTPPSYNLLVRGPANWPKDGAFALEGLVETDWSVATFTMNWKITRPGTTVSFHADEPFCMIVPQRRSELETFAPSIREFAADPELRHRAKAWADRRHQTQVVKFGGEVVRSAACEGVWEGDYFRGSLPDGAPIAEHQTKQRLRPFERIGAQTP